MGPHFEIRTDRQPTSYGQPWGWVEDEKGQTLAYWVGERVVCWMGGEYDRDQIAAALRAARTRH